MFRRPPEAKRTDTSFPTTTLFRSLIAIAQLPGTAADPLARLQKRHKKPGLLEFVRCGQPGNARTEHDNVDAVAQCRLQHRHALRMGGAHQSKRLHSGDGGARTAQPRSEERRVGKEYVRTGRSRW